MTTSNRPRVELLVIDLDDTAWTWFEAWYSSFKALLDGLQAMTGLDRSVLEADAREVHQAHGTSEYSFLVNEMATLRPFVPAEQTPTQYFDSAIHLQNSARKHAIELFPGVLDTVRQIRCSGVPVVAYTESLKFWTEWRFRRLKFDIEIDRLYSSPDHAFPIGLSPKDVRTLPASQYQLRVEQREVPRGISKPNPHILTQIVSEYGVDPSRTAYVGDKPARDVKMAQSVGALDVHAKYGEVLPGVEYSLLQRVSHWPDSDVISEHLTEERPAASYVLDQSFDQLLDLFEFGVHR